MPLFSNHSNHINHTNHGSDNDFLRDGDTYSLTPKLTHGLAGERGYNKLPGEFRTSTNWIGGTRTGNALFVPPPFEYLNDCLSDFEKFLHDESTPVIIKAGLAHIQFETIHPFLDGNGRLGRLLITLLLSAKGMLDEPILYLVFILNKIARAIIIYCKRSENLALGKPG